MKTFAVVNPAAGGGRAAKRAGAILEALRGFDLEIEAAETRGPEHAIDLVRHAVRRGFRHFVAAGGDGTAFEVVNGMFGDAPGKRGRVDEALTLGIIPLGTGNSFLRDFDVRTDADAVAAVKRNAPRPVDLVEAVHGEGSLVFMNLLSLGFPAAVGRMTNERFKRLGAAGYVIAVGAEVARLRPSEMRVRLDEEDWDPRPCTFLTFSNSQFTGGAMRMAPNADPTDGLIDVIRAVPMARRELLQTFPKIFRGTHVATRFAESSQCRRATLDVPEQDVMVDGEVLSLALRELRILPQALKVWV